MNIQSVKSELEGNLTLKQITQSLGEIATVQLKSTRGTVLHNVGYFKEVQEVFKIIIELVEHDKQKQKLLQKNGKTLLLLMGSNYQFNGGLDQTLTRFFIDKTKDSEADVIVVGTTSTRYLTQIKYPLKYRAVTFGKDYPTLNELKNLSSMIIKYSKIYVFHTKFISVLSQVPAISDISFSAQQQSEKKSRQSSVVSHQKKYTAPKVDVNFILEPEIAKMIPFFENQVFITLLHATILESELCRKAARMISMNQAEEKSDLLINQLNLKLKRAEKELINQSVMANFAAAFSGKSI